MEPQVQFREIVENILNRWTALRLAVEHGMAGQNGLQVININTCLKKLNLIIHF
jgi:pre-rRNA-processing protein TSR2